MVCVECGEVFEFFDPRIEERQNQVAAESDFCIDDHSLYLYGVCGGMKKNGKCSKKSV
jgi:Fur family ferric uptake transcriptional regulator